MKRLMSNNRIIRVLACIVIALLCITVSNSATLYADTSSSVPTFTNTDEMSDYYQDQLLNHSGTIKFNYISSCSSGSELYSTFKKAIFKDNGTDPSLMGDYLRFNVYNGSSIKYSSYYQDGKYHYTFTYTVSYRNTLAQEKQFETALTKAMNSLKLSGKSDYAKVKSIYDYICNNVKYDKQHNSSYYLKYTAYAALVNKKAVCQGYSNLFYRMCKEAGIPVKTVIGTSRGIGHAWNIVKLDGKWYNVDSTWDAGCHTYSYFLKSNKNFKDHKASSEYTCSSFTSTYKIASSNYNPLAASQPTLKVKKLSATSVKLSWSKCSSASGYNIYKVKNNGTCKKIASVSSRKSSYVTRSTNAGSNYMVKAYKKIGKSTVYSKASIAV